jgi:hypothetical protein
MYQSTDLSLDRASTPVSTLDDVVVDGVVERHPFRSWDAGGALC